MWLAESHAGVLCMPLRSSIDAASRAKMSAVISFKDCSKFVCILLLLGRGEGRFDHPLEPRWVENGSRGDVELPRAGSFVARLLRAAAFEAMTHEQVAHRHVLRRGN